jgi:hypothetical protein
VGTVVALAGFACFGYPIVKAIANCASVDGARDRTVNVIRVRAVHTSLIPRALKSAD